MVAVTMKNDIVPALVNEIGAIVIACANKSVAAIFNAGEGRKNPAMPKP